MTEHFKTISECEPPEPKQEDWEELLSLPSKRSRKFVYDKMNRKQTAAVFNQVGTVKHTVHVCNLESNRLFLRL